MRGDDLQYGAAVLPDERYCDTYYGIRNMDMHSRLDNLALGTRMATRMAHLCWLYCRIWLQVRDLPLD